MLALEIVTPDGVAIAETDVDVVVLRRRERRFELGSEIAVLPGHGPMLVRIPIAPARFEQSGSTVYLALCGGFAEVYADRVMIVTPVCARVPAIVTDPVAEASLICEKWCLAAGESEAAIVGLPGA
jgi:F-type H+-transporting ATPase subunit epsilon